MSQCVGKFKEADSLAVASPQGALLCHVLAHPLLPMRHTENSTGQATLHTATGRWREQAG